jgi:hypothetical protein
MNNKFNGFTVPSNMNPKVEQINTETQSVEQPSGNRIEGGLSSSQKVEREPVHIPYNDNNENVSQDPTPQSYSAMQRDFVEDNGVSTNTNNFGSLLDQKSAGSYSLDIRNISKN